MHPEPRHAATVAPAATTRHVPLRTCVGCRRTRPKTQLLRFVLHADTVRHDRHQRLNGRGAYVCPDRGCVQAVARHDGRSLRRAVGGGAADHVRPALDAALAAAASGPPPMAATHHEEHTA